MALFNSMLQKYHKSVSLNLNTYISNFGEGNCDNEEGLFFYLSGTTSLYTTMIRSNLFELETNGLCTEFKCTIVKFLKIRPIILKFSFRNAF